MRGFGICSSKGLESRPCLSKSSFLGGVIGRLKCPSSGDCRRVESSCDPWKILDSVRSSIGVMKGRGLKCLCGGCCG